MIMRLGTRGSPLALRQAEMAAAALAGLGLGAELRPILTTGDAVQDRPLAEIGGKALWTKELDWALLQGEVDIAVHSLKDVETALPPGIVLAAVLPRADPHDRMIGAASLDALSHGARLGTSSPRRAAQALAARPDLAVVPLRGNVDTRLARVAEGAVDATLLAAAGLDRLGREVGTPQPFATFLPAPCQGIVGITARADDDQTRSALARIGDAAAATAAIAERALLAALGATCHTPVAAHAGRAAGDWTMTAEILAADGSERVRESLAFAPADAQAAAQELAAVLLARASATLRAQFGS